METDDKWSRIFTLDISDYFDLRNKALVDGFSINAGAKLRPDGSVRISRLEEFLTSGTGQADPKVIHYENGAPIIQGSMIWFSMTTRGYGPIPSSYQGVYSYNLQTREWDVTGTLGFHRGDGIIRPWHATDILFDRFDGSWKISTTSHGDEERQTIYIGKTFQDPRFGYHEFEMEALRFGSSGNHQNEDPSAFFDESVNKWRIAFAAGRSGGFGISLYEADEWDREWSFVSEYASVSNTGILIQKIGGERYVFSGRGDTPCPMEVLSYPGLQKLGELDLDVHPEGRNVWPVIIPNTFATGTEYYLLTFDRSSLFDGWSYGNLHWYYATEFAAQHLEYSDEKSHGHPIYSNNLPATSSLTPLPPSSSSSYVVFELGMELHSNEGPRTIEGLDGVTIEQRDTGELVISGNLGEIWKSTPRPGFDLGTYINVLQADGNWITWSERDGLEVAWKSQEQPGGRTACCGYYVVVMDVKMYTLGIYERFGAQDFGDPLWQTSIKQNIMPSILPSVLFEVGTELNSNEGPRPVDGLEGITIEQQPTGELVINSATEGEIWRSSTHHGPIIGEYTTVLQRDGNFITWRGGPGNIVAWKSQEQPGGDIDCCGDYVVLLDMVQRTLGVYRGSDADNFGNSLWSTTTN